jgi:hypothetical protein
MLPRAVVLIGWALSGPLVFAGCGDAGSTTNPPQGTPTGIRAYEPDAADAGPLAEAAAASPVAAPTYQGNPLCNASRLTGCYPDDMINACDFATDLDEADAEAGAGLNVAPACHVVPDGVIVHTECMPSTVAGMYASSCSDPTECSPGYECVDGGTCRHYCCGGNSACSDNQFCDVQPVVSSGIPVPVCMTELPCVLLDDASCPPADQCSVVRDTGETSCVAVGSAQDGDSCETDHCARGLVCLGAVGAPGSRRCEPLCYTASPTRCEGSNRTCVASLPLFQTAAIGVCQ